jgi:hypothetical protein
VELLYLGIENVRPGPEQSLNRQATDGQSAKVLFRSAHKTMRMSSL